jgi:hypothetical protein
LANISSGKNFFSISGICSILSLWSEVSISSISLVIKNLLSKTWQFYKSLNNIMLV